MNDSFVKSNSKLIILDETLDSFFLDSLTEANKKSLKPVPNEVIYYTKDVLKEFMNPMKFFETSDEGKVRQKILGLKLLEAYQFNINEQKRMYKDVGDSALILCGVFNESINRKILDISYYHQVGAKAYQQLNSIENKAYDYPEFWEILSDCFLVVITLLNRISVIRNDNPQFLISALKQDLSDDELLALGIIPQREQKAN